MNHASHSDSSVDLDHFRPLRLDDLFRSFWRHRVSAIVVGLLLIPMFLFVVMLIPAQYDSYAQLLVRLGRGAVSLDPTASLSQSVSLQDSRSSQVNSVKQMMQSRAMAQRVIRVIGPERILEPRSSMAKFQQSITDWIPSGTAKPLGEMSADEVTAQLEEEAAIKKFQSMTYISSAQDTYTIDLEVRSEDPFLSRDLLATLINVYQEHHAAAHRSEGSYEFFAEQADVAYKRAMAAKEVLRQARTERGMIDVGSSQSALLSLIGQVESDLVETENELASAGSEIQRLVSQIDVSPTTIQSEVVTGIPKTSGSTMRQSLYNLEVKYNELASKYKDNHPKMQALREQLNASARIANDEQGDQPQTKEAINPIRQSLELSHRQTAAKFDGLQSKREKLISKRATLLADLDRLNHDEVDMTEMNWEAELAEQEYLRAAEARDNAKMIDQLASGRVSEIAVVQEASLGLKKVKPQRSILAVLAIAFALGIGIFQALARGLLLSQTTPATSRRNGSPARRSPRFDGSHDHTHPSQRSEGLTAVVDDYIESASVPGVPR